MMKKKWIWIVAAVVVFLGIGAVKNSMDKKAAEESRSVISEPVETAAPTSAPTPTPEPEPEPTPELQALEAAPAEAPAADRAEAVAEEKDWVLNANSMKFPKPSCSSVKDIKDTNRRDVHMTRDAVIGMGYQPCGKCKP